jgi:ParB family chromosome partitioning protein
MSTTAIVRVDPKTLLVGPNVRKEVTLRKEFVASVTEHGILVPIIAQQTADGLEVLDGQMRTLAAVDAGLTDVPVYVQDKVTDAAARIVEQIVVNEDRAALTLPDHVAAIAQLALDFKMPAAEIAKRTGATKDQVSAIVTASKSKSATAAIGAEGVTLELAAKMAEADLNEEEIARVVGYSWNKDQALQSVIAERRRAAETARLTEKLQGEGVAIAAKPSAGEYNAPEKNKHRYLGELVDAATGKKLTTANHKGCAGHGAFVGVRGYNGAVEVHYICTDPSKHGHRDANRAAPVKLTDAERAQKQVEKERAAAWPGITTVRRDWIHDQLLARRGVPAPGWERLVVADLTEEYSRTWGWWQELACELLALKITGDHYNKHTLALREHAAKTPANALRVALASVIARHEYSVADAKARGPQVISALYLRYLAEWGYALSDVEQAIVDDAAADVKAAA